MANPVPGFRTFGGTVTKSGVGPFKGFTVTHTEGTGIYTIVFQKAFTELPGAAVTQVFPGSGQGGSTRDNAILIEIVKSQMKLKTGDDGGSAVDRAFSFVVSGWMS